MEMRLTENGQEDFRPYKKFPASVWGDTFALYSFQHSEFESYCKEVELLKEMVKDLFVRSTKDLAENIELINLLCRLGISYHFESEINKQLNDIFISIPDILKHNDYDLYTLALLFRILRQYGHKMTCDVFKKFKDNNGEFEKSITKDVKGILSLYEASFLSVHGEEILEEASAFTRLQLEKAALDESLSPHLAKHIKDALFLPLHRNVERIATKHFIAFYEQEEEKSRNEILLKFAKLDFNRLQLLYKQEIAELSRWWKDLNLVEQYPYARDRIVECHFWALGMHFEPQFAFSRLMTAKYTALVTVMDDTYDSFGKIDELQQFTAVMLRGTIDAIDQLPEFMKGIYRAILNLHKETEDDANKEKSCRNFYAKEEFKRLAQCNLHQEQWANDGYIPPFEEYMRTAMVTISNGMYPASSFIGMENMVGVEEYEWVQTNTNFTRAIQFQARMWDDIMDDEENVPRASCIKCYMREHGVSRKVAIEELEKKCENIFKDINEESMNLITISKSRILVKYYVNHARASCYFYRDEDFYHDPSKSKDELASLYLKPFIL